MRPPANHTKGICKGLSDGPLLHTNETCLGGSFKLHSFDNIYTKTKQNVGCWAVILVRHQLKQKSGFLHCHSCPLTSKKKHNWGHTSRPINLLSPTFNASSSSLTKSHLAAQHPACHYKLIRWESPGRLHGHNGVETGLLWSQTLLLIHSKALILSTATRKVFARSTENWSHEWRESPVSLLFVKQCL